jgi:bacteriocin-like protein
MQNQFENTGIRELTDAELMQIQGGNIFGDAWNAVTNAASDVAHAVTNAVTHPVHTLQKVGEGIAWLVDKLSKLPPPPPLNSHSRF